MRRQISWLVLFLILVVVVTVLVPAIAKVRDQANRVQCQNNLRSTGLAVHNYYAMFNYLPPGTMANPSLPLEKRFGWAFMIFPFHESENITRRCDKDKAWDAEENQFAARIRITYYRCPSVDWPPDSIYFPTDYLGIAGVGKDAATLPKDDPKAGIFGYDRKITFNDIKDGTYLTVMVVETAWPRGSWTAGGPDTVRGLDPEDSPYMGSKGPFGGNHSGGTNVLFVDGSVHFLKTPFDPPTFEALATYNGSEIISKEKFKVDYFE
jgi:prepilin-type processing-associated H-X9-DG protein